MKHYNLYAKFEFSTIYICVLQLIKKAIFPIGKGISNLSIYICIYKSGCIANQQMFSFVLLIVTQCLLVLNGWVDDCLPHDNLATQNDLSCSMFYLLIFQKTFFVWWLESCKSIFWKYILTVEATKRCKQNIESLEYCTQEIYSIEIYNKKYLSFGIWTERVIISNITTLLPKHIN